MSEDKQETVNRETKESDVVLCFEAQHLAITSHFLYSQMVNEKFATFYACARCGVVFAPDAILGERHE